MIQSEDWGRLGAAVKARRESLGLSVKQCTEGRGISDTTWGKLEAGNPILRQKLAHVPPAISWTPDSVDRVLLGGDPVELEPGGHGGSEGWPAWLEEWLKGELEGLRTENRRLSAQVEALRRIVEAG